jgi:hypothetical protein
MIKYLLIGSTYEAFFKNVLKSHTNVFYKPLRYMATTLLNLKLKCINV